MNVHHLDGYNWCKEKRTNDNNGITLCKNCHTNFHLKYGQGNNTKEQFEKWLGQALQELKDFDGEGLSARKIYCYEEDKIYNSAIEYSKKHSIDRGSVYDICNHRKGRRTLKGQHLFWYDEYINMTKKEKSNWLSRPLYYNSKAVICLNTKNTYISINEACRKLELQKNSISKCCRRKQKYVYSKSGEKLQFMFLDEYLKIQEAKIA